MLPCKNDATRIAWPARALDIATKQLSCLVSKKPAPAYKQVGSLEVCDDGPGFDPTGSFPEHRGLRSMRERATQLGGALEIESAPGRGTCVRAEITYAGEHTPS